MRSSPNSHNQQVRSNRQQNQVDDIGTGVVAFVTYFLSLTWLFSGNQNFDPLINLVPLNTAFITKIIGQAFFARLKRWQFALVSVLVTLVINSCILQFVTWYDAYSRTAFSRDVDRITRNWQTILDDNFDSNKNNWAEGELIDEFGTSAAYFKAGKYRLDVKAKKIMTASGMAPTPPVTDFYASVDVQKLRGPTETNCGLLFRWQHPEKWFFFRVRDDGYFSISFNDGGEYPHPQLTGLIASDAIKVGQLNRIAVFVRGSHFDFLINDVKVFTPPDDFDPLVSGKIDIGVQLPSMPNPAACEFDNFLLRTP